MGSLRNGPMCRARLGSRTTASSGPECAISLAAAYGIYERERLVSITTHNVLQVCISIYNVLRLLRYRPTLLNVFRVSMFTTNNKTTYQVTPLSKCLGARVLLVLSIYACIYE